MFSSSSSICRLAVSLFCLLNLLTFASAADIAYCSALNTADTPKNSSIYQSNGLCSIFCQQDYAFAVVQNDGCWCSNYAPDSTTDGCNRICPGYGPELCGGKGVYGYIQLNLQPSGTQGAGSSSPTTSATTTVSKTPDPVTTTSVIPPPISTSTSTSTSTTSRVSSASTSSTITSTTSSTTWSPSPIISLETIVGQVRTVTVTPTAPPDSNSGNKGGGKLGLGGAVGLTVGLLALVGIVGLIGFFCLRKRRQQKKEEEVYTDTSRESMQGMGGPIPSRTMSENSRYVLGTDGRQVVETWETSNRDAPGKRTSRLMPVDPRLDPFSPVYQRGENRSRESVNTIQDNHDYSRRVHRGAPILRATNPDE